MLRFLFLSVFLYLECEYQSRSKAAGVEPSGGLVGAALEPSEWDPASSRRIRLLLDPRCTPPIYYPSIEGLPKRPKGEVPDPNPVRPFQSGLVATGAEAAIYVEYDLSNGSQVVKILRFSTPEKAESYWRLRQQEGEGRLETVAGEQLLVTKGGRLFRPGARPSLNTVECKSGRYLVRVAEISLRKQDTEIAFALKQLKKIRGLREPTDAPNPAVAPTFQGERQGRRVGDPDRSKKWNRVV